MLGVVIRNANVPICKFCKYFRSDIQFPKEYKMAKCMKFGNQCLVSGEITNLYAERCRRDTSLCGEDGKSYVSAQSPSNMYVS